MAKRKFLICFPYEGDVQKIDKIADALDKEGIDFMQVDAEAPSGKFVSVAKGDIDEVKEDIADVIMTLGDETDTGKTYLERDQDFVQQIYKDEEIKAEGGDDLNYNKDVLVYIGNIDKWIPGRWYYTDDVGHNIQIDRQDLYEYIDDLIPEGDEDAPDLNDLKAVDEYLNDFHGIEFNDVDEEVGSIAIPFDFSTDNIRHPESDILNEDEIITTFNVGEFTDVEDAEITAKDLKAIQKMLGKSFPDKRITYHKVDMSHLESHYEFDIDDSAYYIAVAIDEEDETKFIYTITEYIDSGTHNDLIVGRTKDFDIVLKELEKGVEKYRDKILNTSIYTEDDNKLLQGWNLDEDGFFNSKFYAVYGMWEKGFADELMAYPEVDLQEGTILSIINDLDEVKTAENRQKHIDRKHKIIEDKLNSHPDIATFWIDPMSGTYHFRLKDFPNIDIAATPGWDADDYKTLMSVPVSLNVYGYAGERDDDIPKKYEKEKYMIKGLDWSLSEMGMQADNNNKNPFSLEDPVWDPARGEYIDYDEFADLYYRKVVDPLLGELYIFEDQYREGKRTGWLGRGGGIGHWKKDEKIVQGSEIHDTKKKKTNNNTMLMGGLAGVLLGMFFLNR